MGFFFSLSTVWILIPDLLPVWIQNLDSGRRLIFVFIRCPIIIVVFALYKAKIFVVFCTRRDETNCRFRPVRGKNN